MINDRCWVSSKHRFRHRGTNAPRSGAWVHGPSLASTTSPRPPPQLILKKIKDHIFHVSIAPCSSKYSFSSGEMLFFSITRRTIRHSWFSSTEGLHQSFCFARKPCHVVTAAKSQQRPDGTNRFNRHVPEHECIRFSSRLPVTG